MYFERFEDHTDATINSTLLWEYEVFRIDYQDIRDIVVQRVIERGWPNDWYAMLNLYGVDGVKEAIKNIPYLNDKDMNFVSHQFDIPLSAMKCYEKKQSHNNHWDD